MCGLVAVISKVKSGLYFADKTIFSQMLFADVFRGPDSTGVFGVTRGGNVDMYKEASSSPAFLGKSAFKPFMDTFVTDLQIAVGHNRKATVGAIEDANAHPFIEGNVVLVHNGTLTNHKKLADTAVDSHAICHHINEHGYKSMFENIQGAYALIWYNAAEKKLYFSRNHERTLYKAETSTNIYLASEGKMLDWILDRNNEKGYKVELLATNKVFVFDMETKKMCEEEKPEAKKARRVMTGGTVIHPSHTAANSSTAGATIETFRSGERVNFELEDYETINENMLKFIGTTVGEYKVPVECIINVRAYSIDEIEEMCESEYMEAKITHIRWKRGDVSLRCADPVVLDMKDAQEDDDIDFMYTTSNGVLVSKRILDTYSAQCDSCGTDIREGKAIRDSYISLNPKTKAITYIACGDCCSTFLH